MNLSTSDINETRKSLEVVISSDEVTTARNKLVQEYQKQANLPGFRKGKAPVEMVTKRFEKELKEELQRKLATEAYKHAKGSAGIDIYGVVEVKDDELVTDGESKITFIVDIVPTFELPEYKGIDVKAPMVEIKPEDVDKVIKQIRDQRAEYNVVEREAAQGDYVKLSYEGKIDGQPISEIVPNKPLYGKQATTWEEAGAEDGLGVKAIVEGIIGMKKGDKKEVSMDFPADFDVKELAGKNASYSIEVMEVREKILPEIDEAFLKEIHEKDIDSLKENIEKEIKRSRENNNRMKKRDQIMDFLNEKTEFQVPESSIQGKIRNILQHHIQTQLQQGVPQSELESKKDDLFAKAEENARKVAKSQFIIEKISEKEKIKVSREDLNMMIFREAYAMQQDPKKLSKELSKSPERLQAMHDHALFDKTLDFLVEHASVTFVDNDESAN